MVCWVRGGYLANIKSLHHFICAQEYMEIVAANLKQKDQAQQKILIGISLEYYCYKMNQLEKQLEIVTWEEQKLSKQQNERLLKSEKTEKQTDRGDSSVRRDDSLGFSALDGRWEIIRGDNGKFEMVWLESRLLSGQNEEEEDGQKLNKGVGDLPKESKRLGDKLRVLKEEYQSYLLRNKSLLDQGVVYEVMQSHGRIEDCLVFAKDQNNYQNVITHYVNEQNYKEAIKYLKTFAQKDEKQALEMVYKFSYILLQKVPEEFVKLVLTSVKDFVPQKLISGLMNIPASALECGISFLEQCVNNQRSSDKSMNNLYLFFLANSTRGDQQNSSQAMKKLMSYLSAAEDPSTPIRFDLDFAFRLFEQRDITEAMAKTYALMNFHDLAVKLMLDRNNITLAKEYAAKHYQNEKKKKLWMRIALHMIYTQQPSQSVLELTRESKGFLKVEDLLPHFTEVHQIDVLKEEICANLQEYNNQIEMLKTDVDELTAMSDVLKREINTHSHKYLRISGKHSCLLCHKGLLQQDHYLFRCLHGFHRNCLVTAFKTIKYSDPLFPDMIILNDSLNILYQELKLKHEETLRLAKQDPSNTQVTQPIPISFSISKFLKGIGGAFTGSTLRSTNDQNIQSIPKYIDFSSLQELLLVMLSPEDREQFMLKLNILDNYLARECFICGLEAVDRIHTLFEPIKSQNITNLTDWTL